MGYQSDQKWSKQSSAASMSWADIMLIAIKGKDQTNNGV